MNMSQRARHDAERIKHRALWHAVLRKLRRVPNELIPFDDIKHLHPQSESYGGVQAIPIRHIVGSVDRYRDFDHYFLPSLSLPLDRWIGIRRAQLEGIELPAIQVYKVGNLYFVKDGHHRVSVAREEGQLYIDAEVIELHVPVQPEPGDSLREFIIKGEYGQFLETSQLARLRPEHHEIRFSVPGRYDILLDHIQTHKYYLSLENQRELSRDEAVMSWYDRLYLPVIDDIRKHKVLKRFPGRSEADLYLWIMDHHHFLKEECDDSSTESAAQDYASRYAPAFLERLWRRLRRIN